MNDTTAQLLKWVKNNLNPQVQGIKYQSNVVVQTPWSVVIKIETHNNCYYLKQTPPDLFIEAEIIELIQKHIANSHTPQILAKNNEMHCFLMHRCGDHSLRTKFNGVIDSNLLTQGLENYFNILHSFDNNFDELLALGVPDWRIQTIPDLFTELLEKRDVLIDEGLSFDEIKNLKKLFPIINSLCSSFSGTKIAETLVNADFNENNLILNEATQQISVIDWGESVITHPFFSIAAHLQSLSRRYQLDLTDPLLEALKQNCLGYWLDVANRKELNEIYTRIQRLLPVFSALALYRLQLATNNNSKKMQRWFIAGCLQKLLKNEDHKL